MNCHNQQQNLMDFDLPFLKRRLTNRHRQSTPQHTPKTIIRMKMAWLLASGYSPEALYFYTYLLNLKGSQKGFLFFALQCLSFLCNIIAMPLKPDRFWNV